MGCRLAETDRTVARNYITVLEEEGRSANTIRQAKVVLCAIFGMAVVDRSLTLGDRWPGGSRHGAERRSSLPVCAVGRNLPASIADGLLTPG